MDWKKVVIHQHLHWPVIKVTCYAHVMPPKCKSRKLQQPMYKQINKINGNLNDLMVAYLTDSMLTSATRREGYVSWGVYNLFLTPAHNWIHNCIRD